ncbi:MAG TPA: Hpt domain-containing protein, partial [Dermatophilaceae bacterium]
MEEIVTEFLVESHENLDQLDQDLVALEREPGSHELLSSIFRTVHTIKGTCGFLAFGTLESVTHVGESILSRLRDGEMTLTARHTTVLLEMVDAVRSLLASIEETGAEGDADYSELVGRLQAVLDGTVAEASAPPHAQASAPPPAEASAPPPTEVSDPPPTADTHVEPLIGELLLVEGEIGLQDLTLALTEQDFGDERPLGEILVKDGVVTPQEVSDALQVQAEVRRTVADSSIRV